MRTVLWKFALRHALARPGRTVLSLLSVVIAVAAVTSVSIATSTTRLAYQEMFASVSGRAELEVTVGGDGTFDESVVDLVAEVPGVKVAAPLVQRGTILYANEERVKLSVMGIDPQADRAVRDYNMAEGQFFNGDEGILLDADFAHELGIHLGDEVRMLTRRLVRRVNVVGLLATKGAASLRMSGMVFMPISQAQRLFARPGQIHSIQVVLDDAADAGLVEQVIASRLPAGLTVQPPPTRSRLVEETLSSSEQGLIMATVFSVVLAVFIILNTSMMNVGERRRQLSIMRAVGATRWQLGALLCGETIAMGTLGTLLGSLAGCLGAYVLVRVMSNMLLASLPSLQITVWPFVWGAICGLGVSLVGVAVPAYRASRLTPLEGMTHVTRHDIESTSHFWPIAGALTCLVSGSLLTASILGWVTIDIAVFTAAVFLVGMILLLTAVLGPLSQAVVWLISPLLRVESRLAHRQVLRHRGRTSLTAGVLFLAAATGIGLASAVVDNVNDVKQWYRLTIVGDFFIRAMTPDMGTGLAPDLPDELGKEIRKIPDITGIDTASFVKVRAAGESPIAMVREFTSEEPEYFDLEGDVDPATVRQKLFQGEVVIGTVLAQRTGLKQGDLINMETRQGPTKLRIAALANEYYVGGLAIYMERKVAERLLGVEGVDVYLLRVAPGTQADAQAKLQQLCNEYGVLLFTLAKVRGIVDSMILGIEGCLWGILVLGFLAAAFGVVNTLTMNVLEQTRELGLLRIVAMTRGQVRKTIFTQAVIMALIGVAPGVAAGVGIAYLINLATMQAIGHPIPFGWHPYLLAGSFAGAVTLVLAAALIPAERAARLALAEALQYE